MVRVALSAALIPLLLDEAAPQWACYAVFGGFCLIALLIALLPGLGLLVKLPPKHRKAKEKNA